MTRQRQRFNPKNYVRTVFFGLHGDDNASGLNEDKLKRNFYAANAEAALIPLGAGERGCIVLLGQGEFPHADVSGTGTVILTPKWDVFMVHGTLQIVKGTDTVADAKLVTNNNRIELNRLDTNSGGRIVVDAVGGSLTGSIVLHSANQNIADGDPTTSGAIHIESTALSANIDLVVNSALAKANIFNCESDTANFDIEYDIIRAATSVGSYNVFDIDGANGTARIWSILGGGGAGTHKGLVASGDAEVCVFSNQFSGLDADYEAADTSALKIVTCIDNGNNIRAFGAVLDVLFPPGVVPFDYAQTIFVRTNGDDLEDGLNPEKAVATIIRAHTLAAALLPTATNRIEISLASGEYEIDDLLELGQFIDIIGIDSSVKIIDGGATFGELYLKGNNNIKLQRLYDDSFACSCLYLLDPGATSTINIDIDSHESFNGNILSPDPSASTSFVYYHTRLTTSNNDVSYIAPTNWNLYLQVDKHSTNNDSGSPINFMDSNGGVIHSNIKHVVKSGADAVTMFGLGAAGKIYADNLSNNCETILDDAVGTELYMRLGEYTGALGTIMGLVNLVSIEEGLYIPQLATGAYLGTNEVIIWDGTSHKKLAISAIAGAVGGEDLAATLVIGNITGGTNIITTTDDAVQLGGTTDPGIFRGLSQHGDTGLIFDFFDSGDDMFFYLDGANFQFKFGNIISQGVQAASVAFFENQIYNAADKVTVVAPASVTGQRLQTLQDDDGVIALVANTIKTKAGIVAFGTFALSGGLYKATVTFGTAFSDALYAPTVTGSDSRSWTIETKLAGSFIINSNSNVAPTGDTFWNAIKSGETS